MTKAAFLLLLACGCEATVVDAVREPEPASPLANSLIHRYRFDAEGTFAIDSKGAAHGQVVGTTLPGTGSLTLAGVQSGERINLPNGIVSGLDGATFEAWLTWDGGAAWQRIFDFGSNSGGEDQQGTGTSYLFLTAASSLDSRPDPGGMRVVYSLNGKSDEELCTTPLAFPSGVETHVAVVITPLTKTFALYQDGEFKSECPLTRKLSDIDDVNNWLGHSNYVADPDLAGSYDEFRIYADALTPAQIADSFRAGPDAR